MPGRSTSPPLALGACRAVPEGPPAEAEAEVRALITELYTAFGFDGGGEPDWEAQRARYLEGAVFAAGWWGDAEHSEAIRFGARMAERGGEPEVFAAYAYDSATRVLRVAEGVGLDRPAVAAGLTTDRRHGPVAGRGFGGDRNPVATPHLIRVRPIGFSALSRNAP